MTGNWKKLSLSLGVVGVMVGTAACSGGTPDTGDGSTSASSSLSGDGAVLHIFGANNLQQLGPRQTPEVQAQIREEVFSGFLKDNPEVSAIEWDAQGAQGDEEQRTLTAKMANEPIDLFGCGVNGLVGYMLDRDLVKPYDPAAVAPMLDRFRDTALTDWTVDGELYGIPTSVMSSSTFYYNKDLFAEYGVPDEPTYEDLMQAAPDMAADGIYPVLHQGSNLAMWPMWYFEAFAQTAEDSIAKTQTNLTGETKFTDAADVEAFALLQRWVDDGILSKDSLGVDVEGMRAAFLSGDSAAYYGGTWELSQLEAADADFEWGVFPFPKVPGAAHDPRHGGGADQAICLAADISPEKEEIALKFLDYLTQPEVATVFLEPEKPIASSILGVPEVDLPAAASLRETTYPNTIRFLDWMWPRAVTKEVMNATSGVIGGEMTPEAAAEAVQAAFDTYLEEKD